MKNIVVLISGRGSNFEAILRRVQDGDIPCRIAGVFANRPQAAGLQTAREAGLHAVAIDHTAYSDRDRFDAAMMAAIDACQPDLVVLAGFMRILSENFVNHYEGCLLNIHPSLLPSFPGLHTHERALAEGVKVHGCTVHFVTAKLDHGPIVAQAAVPVLPGDDADTLAARVLAEEHRLYPLAVRWFCEDRLSIDAQGRVALAHADSPAGALCNPL